MERDATALARKASPRQRRKFGLNGGRVPSNEKWKLEIDGKYQAALAADPVAAQFLSIFNEEESQAMYISGEPHLHTLDEIRAIDRERKARSSARDVLSFKAHRGPSLDVFTVFPAAPGTSEDEAIERIDRARAVAARRRTDLGD